MNNLILGYKRGYYRCQAIAKALAKFQQKSTIITDEDNLDTIKGDYDRIFTMSESLLPLQLKLEEKLGIGTLTETTVDILTNKFKFDELVRHFDSNMAPLSICPTCPEDLDIFEDKSVYVKPVVGSGTKDQYGDFRYTAFKSKEDLLAASGTKLFETWQDPDFNNATNSFIVQEYLPTHSDIYALYVYINSSGIAQPIYWCTSRLNIEQRNVTDWQPRNTSFEGIPENEVPTKVKEVALPFYQEVADALQLKSIFVVADFYYFNGIVKYIDVNPRIGQGLVLLDNACDNELIASMLAEDALPALPRSLWKESRLKPGKIKHVTEYKQIPGVNIESNWDLYNGLVIPEEYCLSSQDFHFSLFVTGKEKTDMYETYRSSHNQLQACIEYY